MRHITRIWDAANTNIPSMPSRGLIEIACDVMGVIVDRLVTGKAHSPLGALAILGQNLLTECGGPAAKRAYKEVCSSSCYNTILTALILTFC